MNILTMVLAGGNGTRLHPLTAEDAKPALPFAAGFRIIDFVLSNLANSGIQSIYVLAQYKPRSLIRHIRTAWSPWTEGRRCFVRVVLPDPDIGIGPFKGTADAVYQNLHLIERHRPDLVAVFSADHIYRMDVRQMASFHQERDAQVSIAAVPVPIEMASAFGIIAAGPAGELREFQEKPERVAPMPLDPGRAYASMGNYLFNPDVLVELLEEAKQYGGTDFGYHILPRLPGARRAFVYDFDTNSTPGVSPMKNAATGATSVRSTPTVLRSGRCWVRCHVSLSSIRNGRSMAAVSAATGTPNISDDCKDDDQCIMCAVNPDAVKKHMGRGVQGAVLIDRPGPMPVSRARQKVSGRCKDKHPCIS